jgi:carbamoyltransferase
LIDLNADFDVYSDQDLLDIVAKNIADGKVVGWFDGRTEFGPRALGNRSILGDPRSEIMQTKINLKVKGRESFRPFAPAVLKEHCAQWFALDQDSPYMGMVVKLAKAKLTPVGREEEKTGLDKLKLRRSIIPAVTHVDCTARVQTVDVDIRPRFHALISAFYRLTECPMLLNTSFNMRDEPIVCSPEEAYRCFTETNIDILVVGNCLIQKVR